MWKVYANASELSKKIWCSKSLIKLAISWRAFNSGVARELQENKICYLDNMPKYLHGKKEA
jgi:hypothetical protein